MNIVVAGHLCLDIIPDWQVGSLSALRPGNMVQVAGLTFATGGTVSNTGIALKRLGFDPVLMGRTGDDYIGNIVRDIFRQEGITTDHITCDVGATTSYTVVLNPPGTDRAFIHFPGTNDSFTADDVDLTGLSTGLFHLGYPPLMREMYRADGANLQRIFREAKEGGWITSLDTAMPDPKSEAGQADWQRIFANTLPYVDLFLPSLDELLYMLDREKYYDLQDMRLLVDTTLLDELALRLLKMGTSVVGIKLGDQGFYLRTGSRVRGILGENWENRQLISPNFRVQVQGTTGAGDTTIAGFLGGLLLKMGPEKVLTLASGVGACCVETLSATEGVPDLTTVQKRITGGWERVWPTMAHHDWQRGPDGILRGPEDQVH
jgi:sugar/nucleoside kinase (ribokinase family)